MNGCFGQKVWMYCIGSVAEAENLSLLLGKYSRWPTQKSGGMCQPSRIQLTWLSVSTLIQDEESGWKGPAFLMQEKTGWPEKKIGIKKEADIEVRKQYQEYSQERSFLSTMTEDHLDPTRYSSWTRLTRVSIRRGESFPSLNRFLPAINVTQESSSGARGNWHFRNAFYYTGSTRRILGGSPSTEVRKRATWKDKVAASEASTGWGRYTWRCDGRLKFADYLQWENHYPIILPRNHQITKLIIKDGPEKN